MRTIKKLCLVHLVLFWGSVLDSPPPINDPLARLAKMLPAWTADSTLGLYVQDVQKQLPIYLDWRDRANRIAQQDSISLRIVGQTHIPPNILPIGRGNILVSQYNVCAWLKKLKPDLIGLEGEYADAVAWSVKLSKLHGDERREFIATQGAFKYLQGHRDTPVIGVDDSLLHLLKVKILKTDYDIARISPEKYRAYDRLHLAVLAARSQLAVYRSLIGIQRYQRKNIVLVIGSDHRNMCLAEVKRLGLKAEFYRADDMTLLK